MESSKILKFIAVVFALLCLIWFVFPENGINIAGHTLRFPNYRLALAEGNEKSVDVDSVLTSAESSFAMISSSRKDSVAHYCKFAMENPNRIFLPNNDYTFFDDLFACLDSSASNGTVCRIMHYGDSQIESDRVSAVIRQGLQEKFGGMGPSMIPAVAGLESISVRESNSGSMSRYIIFGDSSTRRASHRRYGVLMQLGQLTGSASISFRNANYGYTQQLSKKFKRVTLLLGKVRGRLTASLKCGKGASEARTVEACDSVTTVTWHLAEEASSGSISLSGLAEVYGVMLDGDHGVALDNVGMRGCSGTVMSSVDETVMRQSFAAIGTRLVILQFGGNQMPAIKSQKAISDYIERMAKEINYFKRVAPQAKILFIGPSDMGRRVNGRLGTWPLLPELNSALREMALANGVAYWDLFNVMGGEGSMVKWVEHKPPLAGPDYIHFSHRGAQQVGDLFNKSMLSLHDFYTLRKQLPEGATIDVATGEIKMPQAANAGEEKGAKE